MVVEGGCWPVFLGGKKKKKSSPGLGNWQLAGLRAEGLFDVFKSEMFFRPCPLLATAKPGWL